MRTIRRAAYGKVVRAWLNTIFTLMVMGLMLGSMCIGAAYLGSWKTVLSVVEGGIAFTLALFCVQELIVVISLRGAPASRELYPRFHEAVDELMQRRTFMARPRLWIVRLAGDLPNAVAFGPGIFGWHSIAITESMYKLLDDDELKAVVAHEFAHIRCKDTGLLTVLSFLMHGVGTLGKAMRSSGNLIGILFGTVLGVASRYLLPIGTAALQQEREYAADALAALYVGSPEPMIRALSKLEKVFSDVKMRKVAAPLSDLYLSHPAMGKRIQSLQALGEQPNMDNINVAPDRAQKGS